MGYSQSKHMPEVILTFVYFKGKLRSLEIRFWYHWVNIEVLFGKLILIFFCIKKY